MNKLLPIFFVAVAAWSCTPKKDPAPAAVTQQATYVLGPKVQSVGVNGVANLTARYTNQNGEVTTVVPDLVSLNTAVVEVVEAGKLKGLSPGTAAIVSRYNNITDTALVTVLRDSTALASLYIRPDSIELTNGNQSAISIDARNLKGQTANYASLVWVLQDTSIGRLAGTQFTARKWGTTTLYAQADGIRSNPIEVAVVRRGTFSGIEGHYGSGGVTVKLKNGQVQVRMERDFLCQAVPDPRVMLSNVPQGGSAIANAGIELAILGRNNGVQAYWAPQSVSIGTYRHAIIYCRQFSQGVLTAELR